MDKEAPHGLLSLGFVHHQFLQQGKAEFSMHNEPEDPDDFSDLIDTTWHTGAGRMSQEDKEMHTQAGFTVLSATDLYRDHDILLTSHFLYATLASASSGIGPHSTVLKLDDHVVFVEDFRRLKYLVCMDEDAEKLIALGYATKA